MTIRLNSVEDVKEFVNIVSKFDSDIDLISARYIVDAKSIVGVLSLDLRNPLQVRVSQDEEQTPVMSALEAFAC